MSDKFENYPAFAFAFAGIVLISFAVITWRKLWGDTAKPQELPRQESAIVSLYADGPIAEALKALKQIGEWLKPLGELPALLKQHHDELGARLREDRGKVYERIEQERREVDAERRDLAAEGDRRDTRINDISDRLARLEGRQGRAR